MWLLKQQHPVLKSGLLSQRPERCCVLVRYEAFLPIYFWSFPSPTDWAKTSDCSSKSADADLWQTFVAGLNQIQKSERVEWTDFPVWPTLFLTWHDRCIVFYWWQLPEEPKKWLQSKLTKNLHIRLSVIQNLSENNVEAETRWCY